MAVVAELVRGLWLEEGVPEEVRRDAETLCHVLDSAMTDVALSLILFEGAMSMPGRSHDRAAWERDLELERQREAELGASDPRPFSAPDYFDWRSRISEQARRDVVRAKWASGELPEAYTFRLPFLHARSFVSALARLVRAMTALAALEVGESDEKVQEALDELEAVVPQLKSVRDSAEHSEDRMRSLNKKGKRFVPGPVMNGMIHAPAGGALIGDALNGRNFGWTGEDGQYAEVEISDDTVEAAREAVQAAFDALPWREHPSRHFTPNR